MSPTSGVASLLYRVLAVTRSAAPLASVTVAVSTLPWASATRYSIAVGLPVKPASGVKVIAPVLALMLQVPSPATTRVLPASVAPASVNTTVLATTASPPVSLASTSIVVALPGVKPALSLLATGGRSTTTVSVRSLPASLGSLWSEIALPVVLVRLVPSAAASTVALRRSVALAPLASVPIVQMPVPLS